MNNYGWNNRIGLESPEKGMKKTFENSVRMVCWLVSFVLDNGFGIV